MNGPIWIGQITLAAVCLISGGFKLFALTPLMQAIEHQRLPRAAEIPLRARLLGMMEVVLGFGLLMPDMAFDGKIPEFFIARSCAAAFAALMIGAAIYHGRRKEGASMDLTMFFLALYVIVGRLPY